MKYVHVYHYSQAVTAVWIKRSVADGIDLGTFPSKQPKKLNVITFYVSVSRQRFDRLIWSYSVTSAPISKALVQKKPFQRGKFAQRFACNNQNRGSECSASTTYQKTQVSTKRSIEWFAAQRRNIGSTWQNTCCIREGMSSCSWIGVMGGNTCLMWSDDYIDHNEAGLLLYCECVG